MNATERLNRASGSAAPVSGSNALSLPWSPQHPSSISQRRSRCFVRIWPLNPKVGSRIVRSKVQVMQNGQPETQQEEKALKSLDSLSTENEMEDDPLMRTLDEEMSQAKVEDQGSTSPLFTLVPILGIAALLGVGFAARDQIKDFLEFFVSAVDNWGPWGYAAFAVTYTVLEVLAVPAIPLTMTAGVIFGPIQGTMIVCASGTLAATIAFLIARYALREKILQLAKRNRRFAAIDKAIGRDGFKFVTLLRLSPLFPFAASNYLYGLTSVDLAPYVAGSFLGSLPGTYAYVSAGHVGKAVLDGGEGSFSVETWQVALGLGVTVLALGFVGQLAKQAIKEMDQDEQKK